MVHSAPHISPSPEFFLTPRMDKCWINRQGEGKPSLADPLPPSPTFPWQNPRLRFSLHWHVLRGRQWAKSTQINHSPCYFYVTYLQPKKERLYHLEFGSRDSRIYEPSLSHLKHHCSVDTAWGTDRNRRSWFLWTHRELMTARPRWRWRIFRTAVLPIYIQDPPPLRYPVEWLTPGYTCASKNIG